MQQRQNNMNYKFLKQELKRFLELLPLLGVSVLLSVGSLGLLLELCDHLLLFLNLRLDQGEVISGTEAGLVAHVSCVPEVGDLFFNEAHSNKVLAIIILD